MKASEIYWQDSALLIAVEMPQAQLCFQLSYPEAVGSRSYSSKTVIFDGVQKYEIHEDRFEGQVLLLNADEKTSENNTRLIRIETNCGYREVTCTEITLVDGHMFELAHRHPGDDADY